MLLLDTHTRHSVRRGLTVPLICLRYISARWRFDFLMSWCECDVVQCCVYLIFIKRMMGHKQSLFQSNKVTVSRSPSQRCQHMHTKRVVDDQVLGTARPLSSGKPVVSVASLCFNCSYLTGCSQWHENR